MELYTLLFFLLLAITSETNARRKFHLGRRVEGNAWYSDKVPLDARAVSTRWFTQVLDHFNPTNNAAWRQRYFVTEDHFQGDGPVFIYIGGEGTARASQITSGSLGDYARKYNALVFQLEHRFYGESHPTDDLSTPNLKYLTSQQALADLAVFIEGMNKEYNLTSDNKWIAFGGSYSASLAVWLRNKYPHLVYAAVSHSGPILAELDFQNYLRIVGESLEVYGGYGEQCTNALKEGFDELEAALETEEGRQYVNNLYELCDPIEDFVDNVDDVSNLFESIADSFAGVVQYYNQSSKSTGIPDVCDLLVGDGNGTAIERLQKVTKLLVYDDEDCFDFTYQSLLDSIQNVSWYSEAAFGMRQWTYQTCTEFGFYQTSNYPTHIFGTKITLDYFIHQCRDSFGSIYDEEFLEQAIDRTNIIFGGLDVDVSNVVYIHGSVDPWHALGIIETVDERDPAIYVPGVSHCASMTSISYAEVPELIDAIQTVEDLLGSWLGV